MSAERSPQHPEQPEAGQPSPGFPEPQAEQTPVAMGREHEPRSSDPILEEALIGLDVTLGRKMSPEDIAERELALQHKAMWLRRAHPERTAEAIRRWLASNLTPDEAGEAFLITGVISDRVDAKMCRKDPTWKKWYER
jgi:hypothetical protein